MTLYEQVKEYLLTEIRKREEGGILPSQTYLVQKFKVCHLTVRRALEDLEKEGLILKRQGKGTFIRKKSVSFSIHLPVVIPAGWKKDFINSVPFMEKLIDEGIKRHLHIHIFPFKENYYEIIRAVNAERFDGLIWLMPWEKDLFAMEEILKKNCHVMVINRVLPGSGFSYVSTDHRAGAYRATRYLLEKGHRKIGFVGYIKAGHIIQRYDGFYQAYIESGEQPCKQWIVNVSFDKKEENWVRYLRRDFAGMMKYKPTSIFVSGVSILLNGVLPVLREKKLRIPHDIEVITYDEIPWIIEEKEAIHEIIQSFDKMGKIAIEKMENIIKKQEVISQVVIQPDFIIKENTELLAVGRRNTVEIKK